MRNPLRSSSDGVGRARCAIGIGRDNDSVGLICGAELDRASDGGDGSAKEDVAGNCGELGTVGE